MTTHEHSEDPRNERVLVYVNGSLVVRSEARVSIFDSGFLMGDGVWEGLRLYDGKIAFLDQHLDRLFEGARAIDLDIGMTREELVGAVEQTIAANAMHDGVHIRLMMTRGLKTTPFQGTDVNVGSATVVIAAEWKVPDPKVAERGLSLFTVHVRRGRPDVQDPRLNTHSKLNCVTASIQAAKAGADEGLMLDPDGFVATCNSTHFFIVRRKELWTSSGRHCLHGITRRNVLEIAREHGMAALEKDFTLTDVYSAEEAFVTGTFAGIIPVREVDGRAIALGPITQQLSRWYGERVRA